jgi:DNA helicase HerA-like ATPase
MSSNFGYVSPQSTNKNINFLAADQDQNLLSVVGKMVYFDTEVENRVYRAIGTVTEIMTQNPLFNPSFNSVVAKGKYTQEISKDLRTSSFITQAVFVKEVGDTEWKQSGAFLPTSPATSSTVHLLDADVLEEMTQGLELPAIGTFRGLDMPMPINTPDFGGNRGAYHSGILGKSGSGKTSGYTFTLCTYMRHEQHAILVVDPQGQWANENGFIFSPQKFAAAMGREVKIIRIAEEVRLPKDVELLSRLIDQMKAWSRLRRMGTENQAIFSQEVAERIMRENLDGDARDILTKVFLSIARSQAAMRRVYADDKIRDIFKEELYALAGEIPDSLAEDDSYDGPSEEEVEDVESSWASILKVFRPLLNLFSSKNLNGERRHSLSGDNGVLSDIFQVRREGSKPAPYVIVDMSPNVKLHAKRALNKDDVESYMATMLDKEAVKALILQVLFSEIKKASETAFASSGGNLNTQIVFDEAWRYAPEGKAIPEIEELANMLEGFAFDTRKFGIGWTYILQSPSDLKRGIWSQLTYIYAAYGLVGNDIKVLEERYSDLSQTEIYKGFISPASTGIYPMMIVGSISPLIFTNSPTFLNMFTSAEEFIEANSKWINRIIISRGLGRVTAASVDPTMTRPSRPAARKPDAEIEVKSYVVSKNYSISEPQYKAEKAPKPSNPPVDDDMDAPF